MRLGIGPRRSAVAVRASMVPRAGETMVARRGIGSAHLIAAVVAAALLGGCDAPLPDEALLKPQPPPKCEPKGDSKGDAGARRQAASADAGSANDAAASMRKLDYEAQCYRHAEMIARARLVKLQKQVREKAKAEAAREKAAKAAEKAAAKSTEYVWEPAGD